MGQLHVLLRDARITWVSVLLLYSISSLAMNLPASAARSYKRMRRRRFDFAVFLLILVIACTGVANESIPGQPSHHVAGGFRNPNPDFHRPSAWTRWSFVVRRLWTTSVSARTFVAPRVSNDGAALRAGGINPSLTWVGHATLLVQING